MTCFHRADTNKSAYKRCSGKLSASGSPSCENRPSEASNRRNPALRGFSCVGYSLITTAHSLFRCSHDPIDSMFHAPPREPPTQKKSLLQRADSEPTECGHVSTRMLNPLSNPTSGYKDIEHHDDPANYLLNILGIKTAPHFTTLQKAEKRILKQGRAAKLLEESIFFGAGKTQKN